MTVDTKVLLAKLCSFYAVLPEEPRGELRLQRCITPALCDGRWSLWAMD